MTEIRTQTQTPEGWLPREAQLPPTVPAIDLLPGDVVEHPMIDDATATVDRVDVIGKVFGSDTRRMVRVTFRDARPVKSTNMPEDQTMRRYSGGPTGALTSTTGAETDRAAAALREVTR